MGLFDIISRDPEQQSALVHGLLAGAFGAMAGRGTRLQAIGQGGLTGLQGYVNTREQQEQAKRQGLSEEMNRMQLDALKRQQAGEQAAQNYVTGALAEPDASMTPDMPGPRRDPAGFNLGSALAAGVPMNMALQMSGAFQKQQPKMETIAPGAKAGYFQNGRWIDVASNPKPEDLPNAVQEYKFAVGQGYRGTFEQWDKERKKAGATNIAINPEKAFAQALGPIAAKNIEASQTAAEAAQGSNATIRAIRDAMKGGNVIMGPGAEVIQTARRVGQMTGAGSQASADSLANTKIVEQGLAQIELDAAKLMKGQGQITEAERAIIRRAAAGDIGKLTPQELDVALRAIERNNNRALSTHQQRMQQVPGQAAGALSPLLNVPTMTEPNEGWSIKKK